MCTRKKRSAEWWKKQGDKENKRLNLIHPQKREVRVMYHENPKRMLGWFNTGMKFHVHMNLAYFQYEDDLDQFLDTLRHEWAHLVDYQERGYSNHDSQWRRVAIRMGATPRARSKNLENSMHKHKLVCKNCGPRYSVNKRPSRPSSCGKCGNGVWNPELLLMLKREDGKEDVKTKNYVAKTCRNIDPKYIW